MSVQCLQPIHDPQTRHICQDPVTADSRLTWCHNCFCTLSITHTVQSDKSSEGHSVLFLPLSPPLPGPALTYSSVVHARVVHPAQGLLHLALQGDGGLGRPHVGHGPVGFGLQGQQRRPDLLGQGTGLGTVAFPPEAETDRQRQEVRGRMTNKVQRPK